MDTAIFDQFGRECAEKLPEEIDQILKEAAGNKSCAIGFITTDDFYGAYLAWDCGGGIDEYYDWENGRSPDFLYQPLVDVVDACKDIDFCNPSPEKWGFAQALLAVLDQCIRQIPDEVFSKNGFRREDVLFFAAMGDGDYIQELMDASVRLFNRPEALEAFGL